MLVVAGDVLKRLTASNLTDIDCREQLQPVPAGGHGFRVLHRRPPEGAGAIQDLGIQEEQ